MSASVYTIRDEAVQWTAPVDEASISVLRANAARWLKDFQVAAEPSETTLLLVSELLTNALRHGGLRADCADRLVLRLAVAADRITVECDDRALETWPALAPRSRDPLAVSGNGLVLVAALAERWGFFALSAKTVFAIVSLAGTAPAPDPRRQLVPVKATGRMLSLIPHHLAEKEH